jgi:hypothetical protein
VHEERRDVRLPLALRELVTNAPFSGTTDWMFGLTMR